MVVETLIGFIGSHVQALPEETMRKEPSIDFVCLNEGVYTIRELIALKDISANVY